MITLNDLNNAPTRPAIIKMIKTASKERGFDLGYIKSFSDKADELQRKNTGFFKDDANEMAALLRAAADRWKSLAP